jgi:hypothetical protein
VHKFCQEDLVLSQICQNCKALNLTEYKSCAILESPLNFVVFKTLNIAKHNFLKFSLDLILASAVIFRALNLVFLKGLALAND